MISKKRHKLTMMLLSELICEYDSVLTLSKILGVPKTTIHSWKRLNNISDAGLEIIASNLTDSGTLIVLSSIPSCIVSLQNDSTVLFDKS